MNNDPKHIREDFSSACSPTNTISDRYHGLDAARAFALLLGVLWHAAESFGPRNNYWGVVDCSPSAFLEWFRFVIHAFRMELFFVIAGFFARLMISRRGTADFVRNRVGRILVPLVIGWVFLYPILVLIWLWGWSWSGHLDKIGLTPELQKLPAVKMYLPFLFSHQTLQNFGLFHLWFLYQLVVLYAFLLCSRWLAGRSQVIHNIMLRCDEVFARTVSSPGSLCLFSFCTVPILLSMHNAWTVDTPARSLVPEASASSLFGLYFMTGWFLHRQPHLLKWFGRRWKWNLWAGTLILLVFMIFGKLDFWLMMPEELGITPIMFVWIRAIYMCGYAGMMWAFIWGFIGLFMQVCHERNAWIRYVADASYWIYLVHLPLVITLQVLVSGVAKPWLFKYAFITTVTFFYSFLSYHYLVRGTFIGVQLNGRRYPLNWPWRKSRLQT